jgi:hypothetical protein
MIRSADERNYALGLNIFRQRGFKRRYVTESDLNPGPDSGYVTCFVVLRASHDGSICMKFFEGADSLAAVGSN